MTAFQITRVGGTRMNVNSYLVESRDALVIVDGMLTVDDARAVRARIAESRAPLRGLIVTHAHPDHYAGAAEILAGRDDVPILATMPVKAAIERDDATKDAIVGPMMGAQWPSVRRTPDRVVRGEVTLGDLTFRVRDVGPGESPADSLWSLDERSLFVGDLAYNGMHAYLADGLWEDWLRCLDRLEVEVDPEATLFPGHGERAGRALLDTQRRYIHAFVESVGRHRAESPDERRASVVADMRRHLPTDDLLFLMELSVDPVAAALERR